MLNLSNHFIIMKAWLLLETRHGKWAGLQLSQWCGLFSDMSTTLTRPPRCMKLYGRITVLFIWWLNVCHGVTSLCQVNVWLVENENLVFCFQLPNVCQIGKDCGKYGQWVYVIAVKCNNSHFTVFRNLGFDMEKWKLYGLGIGINGEWVTWDYKGIGDWKWWYDYSDRKGKQGLD